MSVTLKHEILEVPPPKARLPTLVRILSIVFVTLFHLVSILILTVSLATGSGSIPAAEAAAIGLQWLALITMATIFLHRVRHPEREYIRPRSLLGFSSLLIFSLANFILLLARLADGKQSLIAAFNAFPDARATAYATVVMAGLATLFSATGFVVSYFGCYIEPFPKPKPWISRPILDWHPHPVETPVPGSPDHSVVEFGHMQAKYIPALIPAWKPTIQRSAETVMVTEKWSNISLR